MSQRQHTTPMMVRDGQAVRLHPVGFLDRTFDETWLQKLLFEHPALIPLHEIESIFGDLIPVARELPTAAGPLDVLYVNAQGFLTLVETKLWRNPEARRSVIAQLIDYTKEIARWSYSDLIAAIRKSGVTSAGDPLLELARGAAEDFDEATFTDAVSRNLRRGRFLLIIIGDGIREDVEHMAEFLQQTPQLGFTLGLVEIGLYRVKPDEPEPLIVQPRIVARTKEVVRAIVEIRMPSSMNPADVQVTLPVKEETERRSRRKITEEEFFEELARNADRSAVELSRWVLDNAQAHQLDIMWGDAGPLLRWIDEASGDHLTLGQLRPSGHLASTEWFFRHCLKLGLPVDIWKTYSEEVARLIPGAYCRKTKWTEMLAMKKSAGKSEYIPLALLWPHKDEWLAAIDRAIARLHDALDSSPKG